MVTELGECKFASADFLNVPVNIRLRREKNEEEIETGLWELTADVYQPRKDRVVLDQYCAISESREELVALVIKQYILPLYETAVRQLQAICQDKADSLYFWEERNR